MTKIKMISPYVYPGIKKCFLPKKFLSRQSILSPEEVLDVISKETYVSIDDIIGKTRKSEAVIARHIFCGVLKNEYKYSLTFIGNILSRDHTTIINAVRQYMYRKHTETEFQLHADNILEIIKIK
jgi:chromosomal replication initiator protein